MAAGLWQDAEKESLGSCWMYDQARYDRQGEVTRGLFGSSLMNVKDGEWAKDRAAMITSAVTR